MINELSANELSVNYPSSRQGALDVDDGQSLQRESYAYDDLNFHEEGGLLPQILADDWMAFLLKENQARLQVQDDVAYRFFHPKVVQYLFTICLRLRLPQDVKYTALNILNEYIVRQLAGSYNLVYNLRSKTDEQKLHEWHKLRTTISRQMVIRVITSIQIASKLCSSNDSLTVGKVNRCLQTLGYAYTESAIKRSELRVLTTVDYCTNARHTPIVYLESFLGGLFKTNSHLDFDTKNIWNASIVILDCVYLRFDEVHRLVVLMVHYQNNSILPPSEIPREQLLSIQSDYALISCAVIYLALVCIHGKKFAKNLLVHLCRMANNDISFDDIFSVCNAISNVVLSEKSNAAYN